MFRPSTRLAPLLVAMLIAACGSDDAVTQPTDTAAASGAFDLIADVPYTSTQQLDIYVPDGGADRPVVVFLHGGNPARHPDERKSVAHVGESLAARGVVTYVPTWNGMGPAGGSQETICAIAYAHATAAEHGGDPERVMPSGYSAGGYSAVIHALVGDAPPLPVEDCAVDPTIEGPGVVAAGGAPFFVNEWARAGQLTDPAWADLSPEQVDAFDPFLAVEAGSNPGLRIALLVGEDDVGGRQFFPIAESTLEFDEAARNAGYDVELTVVRGGHVPPLEAGTEQFETWMNTIVEAAHSQP